MNKQLLAGLAAAVIAGAAAVSWQAPAAEAAPIVGFTTHAVPGDTSAGPADLVQVQQRRYRSHRAHRSHRWNRPYHRSHRSHRPRYRGGIHIYPPFWGAPYYGGYYGGYSPYYYRSRPRVIHRGPYRGGSCGRWERRCAANWGYGNADFYGCLRYHGC